MTRHIFGSRYTQTKLQKLALCGSFLSLFFSTACQALIVEFFQELAALSEFNRQNRQALYDAAYDAVQAYWYPEKNLYTTKRNDDSCATASSSTPTFENLPGIPYEAREIADFLKNPERFTSVGAYIPRGILLYGPPGTGKTSIARVIAHESDAQFFPMSGSEFVELYVGVGPQRVRDLFEQARRCSKAVIFIDEIDAIGGSRSELENSEYKNTLNELLNQMDGFNQNDTIIVIAATNRIDTLDKALLRPGRFDRLINIPLPNQEAREKIIRLYCSKISFSGDEKIFSELALKSRGLSGAEIKNAVNEAALLAAREEKTEVTEDHLRASFGKGSQR